MEINAKTVGPVPEMTEDLLSLVEWLGSEARQSLHHVTGFLHLLAEEPLTVRQAHNLKHCASGLAELLRTVNVVANLAESLAAPGHPDARCSRAIVASGEGPAGRMSLLVAEDNDESFALFEAFVEDAGHSVERASDGEQAVAAFQRGQFDLVVMDVRMPVMDGYTATRLIREWETVRGTARVPIILMSAESSERLTHMGAEVGCSGYLTKPTMQEDLLRVLRHYGPVPR